MVTWAIVGIIAGAVLGLTGAGGAIASIPLFMMLEGLSLREATVAALFVVFTASLANLIPRYQQVHYRVSVLVVVFSILGSFLAASLKAGLPSWVLQLSFASVCLFSLYRTWAPKLEVAPVHLDAKLSWSTILKAAPLLGVSIGFLITFTGLGGGVILVPFLGWIFGMSPQRAVSTSLFCVWLNSIGSIAAQWNAVQQTAGVFDIVILSIACLILAQTVSRWIRSSSEVRVEKVRRVVFTAFVIAACTMVLIKETLSYFSDFS